MRRVRLIAPTLAVVLLLTVEVATASKFLGIRIGRRRASPWRATVRQPADKTSKGFAEWRTVEEVKRRLEAHPYRGTGLWIAAVEGRWHNGVPQYRLREESVPKGRAHWWYWWYNLDEESFSRKRDEYARKGFHLVHHQSYTKPDDSVRHQAVWQKLGEPEENGNGTE